MLDFSEFHSQILDDPDIKKYFISKGKSLGLEGDKLIDYLVKSYMELQDKSDEILQILHGKKK